jgi:hypothetical protein
VELRERHRPDRPRFALPGTRHVVGGVALGVPIEGVVGDVDRPTGIPVGELRTVRIVAHGVVALVELDAEIVDEFVPEPIDARLVDPGVAAGPRDQFVVVGDPVLLHERVDVRGFDERLAWFVNHFVELAQGLHTGGDTARHQRSFPNRRSSSIPGNPFTGRRPIVQYVRPEREKP